MHRYDVPDAIFANTEIDMRQDVASPTNLPSRYFGMLALELIGQVFDGFADDFNVP